MRVLLFCILFFPFVSNANSYSLIESLMGEQAYQEFLHEQRLSERACGHLRQTYSQFYGQDLEACHVVYVDNKPIAIAKGVHGDLSKAELLWLKQALNLESAHTKINFIMSDYLFRENLVPQSGIALEFEWLF